MTIFTEEYVQEREKKFDELFESIYNDKILEVIFSGGSSITKHDAFLEKFEPAPIWNISFKLFRMQRPDKLDWLFSPTKILEMFEHECEEKNDANDITADGQ